MLLIKGGFVCIDLAIKKLLLYSINKGLVSQTGLRLNQDYVLVQLSSFYKRALGKKRKNISVHL